MGGFPETLAWAPFLRPPHEAGALQVGWPQTPASWVRAPHTLRGHGCRLADLSGLWLRPCTSRLPAATRGSWEPAHLGTATALPALQALVKARSAALDRATPLLSASLPKNVRFLDDV